MGCHSSLPQSKLAETESIWALVIDTRLGTVDSKAILQGPVQPAQTHQALRALRSFVEASRSEVNKDVSVAVGETGTENPHHDKPADGRGFVVLFKI